MPPLRPLWLSLIIFFCLPAVAQERPYFTTYSHDMEEPGSLGMEFLSVNGKPPAGNQFLGSSLEFEYGVKTGWTTEFYFDGQ